MGPIKWLLLLAGAVAIFGYTIWWYRTREEPVAARKWVATLRVAALSTAWLILLNPSLPAGGGGSLSESAVAIDASFSMSSPAGVAGESVWSRGLDSVAEHAHVWLVGDPTPRQLANDSLPAEPPYGTSLLAPAVRSIAAAGARRVIVYTDGRLTDLREARSEAHRRGLVLSLIDLESPTPDAAISAVNAPGWVQSGDTVEVRVEIMARGVAEDSLRVEIVDGDGRSHAEAWAVVPSEGRFGAAVLAFQARGRAGFQRFVVRLAPPDGDLERRNDERPFYLRVTEQAVGPVLISLRPDWEPSFLIDNLDRLSDARTTAYVWLADSLVTPDGYHATSRATARRRALAAPLVVVHGFGAESPVWVGELVRDASRILVFADGRRGFELPGWDVRVLPPAAGEWYAAPEVPASPLALDLGGISLEALPPLLEVRAVEAERAWSPLELRRLRRGESRPAVVLGRDGGRRFAVAAARGYWRWAFRDGDGRQLYRALWTGVAGWLAASQPASMSGLEPGQRVVARGESLRWTAPEGVDSLNIALQREDGDPVFNESVLVGDSLAAALPPGRYRYRARAFLENRVASTSEGPVEVEEFSAEFLPRPQPGPGPAGEATRESVEARRSRGERGLATLGWPYLILIALFCAEWALRRWSGLR